MIAGPAAIRAEDCENCRGAKSLPPECPRLWEHVACSQAEELARQAERIRELIRERDHEKSQTEAACDLAEQYARKTGVDIGRDDTLRYVEQYWEQRGKFEKEWTDLETLRWDIFRLRLQIDDALEFGPNGEPGAADKQTGRVVAERVRDWLRSHPNLGGSVKRRPDLFSRPAAPVPVGQMDLLGSGSVVVDEPMLCDGCGRTDRPVQATDDGRALVCADCRSLIDGGAQ